MAPIARPENTLKRADELIAVDQPAAALDLLYETITSKKTRSVSLSFLEPIVLRLVELSVSLRKSKLVKDGLHQYKKLLQQSNINSIEVVIKHFLELAEQKVTSAQAESIRIAEDTGIDADEDLDAGSSPEDILLSTVSSEEARDRTDREVVTPWLKFLWEAYRSTLDVLRNNSQLEKLYQAVVSRAFNFCLKYNRKTEFRRLCELLRNHLQSAATPQHRAAGQLNQIDLSDPDTIQRYLDTRFDQVSFAVKLELWQEAFRSVEDVHTLLTVSKRPAKVITMANYYENLARIFNVSGNQLFHAAAWSRYYSLVLQARSVPESELTRIASLLMLSALSIPTFSQQSRSGLVEVDEQKHRNTRLTGLLNLTKTPTRESLLQSALAKNVLAYVRPEIKELYRMLEVDFHPLSLRTRLGPVLEKIGFDTNYQPYVNSLYQVILARLFQQLSQVYKTVRLDFVIKLATFPKPFEATPVEIEKFIVRGCQKGEFAIRIDHESKSITFVDDLYDASARASSSIINNATNTRSAASLQATPSDIVRTQLSRLSQALYTVVNKVDAAYIGERDRARQAAIERAVAGIAADRAEIRERKIRIEERQKAAAAEKVRREEEEAKARAQRLQEEQQAERDRLAAEQKRRELERIKKEQDAIREQEKRKIAEEINSKGIIKIDVNNLEDLDTNKLRTMQVEQLAKENKDLNERLRIIGRRMDHIERAFRQEEITLWKEDAEIQEQRDKKAHDVRNKTLLEKSKQTFEEQLVLKNRLEKMVPDYQAFRSQFLGKRQEAYLAKQAENQRLLEEAKQKRIEQKRKEFETREKRRLEEEEQRQKEAEEAAKEAAKKPSTYVPGAFRGATGARPSAPPPAPAPLARPTIPSSLAGGPPSRPMPPPTMASRGPPPPTMASRGPPPPQRAPSGAPSSSTGGGYVPPHLRNRG
ncbi:eukaryotic translation initiation factor 3 subunit A [Trichomonascus vanleenenianus]|uniref:translation initiation factor eIF3 core subunit a n=1 Tax=Trichomonascus vanleenenianus TaxID=2268995 RepID=UPI003ECA19F5